MIGGRKVTGGGEERMAGRKKPTSGTFHFPTTLETPTDATERQSVSYRELLRLLYGSALTQPDPWARLQHTPTFKNTYAVHMHYSQWVALPKTHPPPPPSKNRKKPFVKIHIRLPHRVHAKTGIMPTERCCVTAASTKQAAWQRAALRNRPDASI